MALGQIFKSGTPLKLRGQGAVEAIVTLPVFLILICIIFQLFLLGIAQVQLQYAAFYAARAGSVNDSDTRIMRQAVRKILAKSPGTSYPDSSFRLEIIERKKSDAKGKSGQSEKPTLEVLVGWDYPLIIPFTDIIFEKRRIFPTKSRPVLNLQASWIMGVSSTGLGDESSARY